MSEYNVKASLKTGEKFVVSLKWNAQDQDLAVSGLGLRQRALQELVAAHIGDDSNLSWLAGLPVEPRDGRDGRLLQVGHLKYSQVRVASDDIE